MSKISRFTQSVTWWFQDVVSSVDKGSNSESFQLAVLILRVRVQAGAESAKIAYSMKVRIAQASYRVVPK